MFAALVPREVKRRKVEARDPHTVEATRRTKWPPREHLTERRHEPDLSSREGGPSCIEARRERCEGKVPCECWVSRVMRDVSLFVFGAKAQQKNVIKHKTCHNNTIT